ncbi:putative MFS family arabinose efflux permease [Actinomadura pelletieri DSM 43383]|uniref:Putative MFS family arabinose efflux permease n=1 Tax=Actinomadura pelletieri DSM 43383 TaxID=1120940 RepID=A0A495QX33_9ACTN|nr:MFS transporter [Actinomadura pelletieri]RKS78745.1 putative MFS family arabinose efflux permease [Actinomadura pelletieri DSM 43383]
MPAVVRFFAPLALLKNRSIAPLFASRLVSSAGVGFGQLALAWGVMGLGYGAAELSVVMASKAAPAVLMVAVGVAGDRFRRHHVLVSAEILASSAWLGLGACFLTDKASLPLLCGLAVLSGVATAMFLPTIRGIVADLLTGQSRRGGNALVSQTESAGLLVGLASSGVVVSTVGAGWAATARGLLCVVSALLLGLLKTLRHRHSGGITRDLRVGWKEFSSCRWVWTMALQFTVLIVSAASFIEVIGPLYMTQGHGGAWGWGIVTACEAFAALVGALVGARLRVGQPILVATALPATAAIPMLFVSGGCSWTVIALAIAVPGLCQAAYYVIWTTTLQEHFSAEVLVRVNSWSIVASYLLAPIALLTIGPAVEAVGPSSAAFVTGVLVLVATALALLSVYSARLNRPASASQPEPAAS